MKMHKGDRIYYTGDRANAGDCFGTVVNVNPAGKYGPESYDVLLDEERFEGDTSKMARGLYGVMFDPGIGRRFWPAEEWEADRKKRIEEMMARMRKVV